LEKKRQNGKKYLYYLQLHDHMIMTAPEYAIIRVVVQLLSAALFSAVGIADRQSSAPFQGCHKMSISVSGFQFDALIVCQLEVLSVRADQESLHYRFVLFCKYTACAVDQVPAGGDEGGGCLQEGQTLIGQGCDLRGFQTPADLRVAPHCPAARTGRIDQANLERLWQEALLHQQFEVKSIRRQGPDVDKSVLIDAPSQQLGLEVKIIDREMVVMARMSVSDELTIDQHCLGASAAGDLQEVGLVFGSRGVKSIGGALSGGALSSGASSSGALIGGAISGAISTGVG
jgi:hypothetical protein